MSSYVRQVLCLGLHAKSDWLNSVAKEMATKTVRGDLLGLPLFLPPSFRGAGVLAT